MVDEALRLGDVGGGGGEDGGEDEAVLLDLLALVRDRRRAREGALHGRAALLRNAEALGFLGWYRLLGGARRRGG